MGEVSKGYVSANCKLSTRGAINTTTYAPGTRVCIAAETSGIRTSASPSNISYSRNATEGMIMTECRSGAR